MTTKLYCVHVHERAHIYENVAAANPAAAEEIIMAREWAGNYDDIVQVEVLRQCECGVDNDTDNKLCEACGEALEPHDHRARALP